MTAPAPSLDDLRATSVVEGETAPHGGANLATDGEAAPSIAERRAALEGEVARLRALRGAAVVDGAVFDAAPLNDALAALDGLADAEVEAHRRALEVAAVAEEARVKAVRGVIREHDAARLAAIAAAEAGCRAMVEAFDAMLSATSALTRAAHSIPMSPSVALSVVELKLRLSRLLSTALSPVRSSAQSFGVLEWPTILFGITTEWAAAEQSATGAAIADLLGEVLPPPAPPAPDEFVADETAPDGFELEEQAG